MPDSETAADWLKAGPRWLFSDVRLQSFGLRR